MRQRFAMMLTAAPPLLMAAFLAGIGTTSAQQQEIQRKLMLQQDLHIPGQLLVMQLVEIPAGVREVRHTHPGVLSIYVMDGTLTLEHEGRPTTIYKTGDAFYVEANKIHYGINASAAPVKLLTTLIAEKGKPLNTPAP